MTATPVLLWQRSLRRSGLPAPVLAVLFMLGTYADANGRNAFPGETRLSADTGLSARTVRRHLDTARQAGWITRDETSGGRSRGRGLADRYMLTIPHRHVSEATSAADTPAPAAPTPTPVDNPPTTGHRRPVDNQPPPDTRDATTGQPCPVPPVTSDRPPIPVPTPRPITRARAAEHAAAVDILARMTGKTIDHDHAERVVRQVLDTRTVRNRLAYLRAALERDPWAFLPTPIPPRFVPDQAAA